MNCLWRPCLLKDRDDMSSLYRGPSIDASYQVSIHLAEGFQRRRLKCEKLTDDKWWQKLTLPLARWAKKGALDSQPQVIKFTSCLPMVGGSLRVLRFLPPLKPVAMIYSWNIAESGIKHKKINQSINNLFYQWMFHTYTSMW